MKVFPQLPIIGDIVEYRPTKGVTFKAFVLQIMDDIFYLYLQNKIIAVELDYSTLEAINTFTVCDYCIVSVADCILDDEDEL